MLTDFNGRDTNIIQKRSKRKPTDIFKFIFLPIRICITDLNPQLCGHLPGNVRFIFLRSYCRTTCAITSCYYSLVGVVDSMKNQIEYVPDEYSFGKHAMRWTSGFIKV